MGDGGGHGKGKGTKGKSKSKCSPEEIRHAAQLNAWRDSEDLPRKSPGSVTRAKARSAAFHAAKAAALDAQGIGPPVVKRRAYFFTPFCFFLLPFFFLSPWSPGPLVPWSSGPVVLWSRGPLVPWSLGLLGPLVRCSPLVPWSSQVYKVTSIPCEAANRK